MHIEAFVQLVEKHQKPNMVVVEVGCWVGTTTVEYAKTVKKNNGKIILIDTFEGSPGAKDVHAHNPSKKKDIHNTLIENLKKHDLLDVVDIRVGNSHDEIPKIPANSVDICLVDGDHRYSHCKKDMELCLGKVKKNGFLVMHDVENIYMADSFTEEQLEMDYCRGVHPGPIQAVWELFGSNVNIVPSFGVAPIAVYTVKHKYFDEIKKSMDWLAQKQDTLFLGQAVGVPGTAMSSTLKDVPHIKLLELPVFEETQLGMSLGLSLQGYFPISIFPRHNFLFCAYNQLINHVDKLNEMSNGGYKPRMIIRTGVGSERPLHPQNQHVGNPCKALKSILKNTEVIELDKPENILEAYQYAYNRQDGKVTLISEFGDYYNEK